MLGSMITSRTTASVRRALRELIRELRIQRRHHASLRRLNRYPGPHLKINAGCGPNIKAGWVNVDLSKNAELQLDLREPLPFRDGSASVIYSEHFFEHLEYPDEALRFLRESLRVLEPGGLFSVGVPDAEGMLHAYVYNDEEVFQTVRARWHPAWCNTRMHNVNYHFRQGGEHEYAYDFETLARVLAEVGFVSIVGRAYNPDLDSEERQRGTVYIDARKPQAYHEQQ